ncbi:hypothetical protein HI914_04513 [Erysiphe necator]|nr:hypothetical protein HI914_04513 [Erysiphe necator]
MEEYLQDVEDYKAFMDFIFHLDHSSSSEDKYAWTYSILSFISWLLSCAGQFSPQSIIADLPRMSR